MSDTNGLMTIEVNWFKPSGKWYASARVTMKAAHIFEDAFKQNLVNAQAELFDGWQDNGYYVTTQNAEPYNVGEVPFALCLWKPDAFKGLRRV